MKKNKIIVAVIFVLALYATISAMSGDGGQQPVKPEKKTEAVQAQDAQQNTTVAGQTNKNKQTTKEIIAIPKEKLGILDRNNNPLPEMWQRDERYPIKTIQTKKGDLSYYRAKKGDVIVDTGGSIIFSEDIVKDSDGKETVLSYYKHKTGLSVDEFVSHYYGYMDRVYEILTQKGITTNPPPRSISMWYDNRVNLEKLDELKQNGFDALPKDGLGIGGGSLPSISIVPTSIIIGEVIGFEKINHETFGYSHKIKIQIDEILKPSEIIGNTSTIECFYNDDKHYKVPMNSKIVAALSKSFDNDKARIGLPLLSTWFDIIDGKVTHNNNSQAERKIMLLEEFKEKIKNIIRINDADNFYKRSWKEEDK